MPYFVAVAMSGICNPIPENADKTNTKTKIQSITKIFFIAYRFHIYGTKFGIQVESER